MRGGSNKKPASSRQSNRRYPAAEPGEGKPEPHASLNEEERGQFDYLVGLLPEGVGTKADGATLSLAAKLLVKAMSGDLKAATVQQLRGLLTEFGLTFAGRQRLDIKPPKPENPFARFK